MSEVDRMQKIEEHPLEGADHRRPPVTELAADPLPRPSDKGGRSFEPWLLGGSALLLLVGGLAIGASQLRAQNRQVMAISAEQQNFVPNVRVAEVRASDSTMVVNLPSTTLAFAAANIFARASGYIEKRQVDIGDHVKAGDLLAQITAPELDHQIAQNEATLRQNQASLQQTAASRDLASVTNARDSVLVKKGWVTAQQGDTDRLTLQAQEAAVAVAQSNIAAQENFIRVLNQQKAYQSVVAPFDGIITQRSIDVGSLVQAGSTLMFTLMQSDVIRTQVYVPQNAAFGVQPGVKAIVRVPEMPDHAFPGEVTRLADALAPGTRTLLTEIDVANPERILRPGMYSTVELHIPRKTPSFTVPADALIFNAEGLQVAVVANGIAHLRRVAVARDLGREVEIRDGVQIGDLVILRPTVDLADGSKVRPQIPQTQMSRNERRSSAAGKALRAATGAREL
jgi:RND family efflux transporter MFP subunit